ncbi:head completion/stabilization protein [Pseudomonas solani]|uniref:head completion/stabilization protein n=1 Tax=Pseudomonas solani TaxID=2731552 RepID=UPI003F4A9BAC
MSGFIAGGTPTAFTLSNDGFWPDIDANALRDAQRIDGSVSNARLEVATVAAMLSVNADLRSRKRHWQAAGHTKLASIPSERINGISALVHTYKRAVYAATSAEIAERYRTFDATNSGEQKAADEAQAIDDYRRDQRWAVRDLLGVRRTTVELI